MLQNRRALLFVLNCVIVLSLVLLPTMASAQDTASVTHVVQAGENLFRIGLQYGFTAEQLALANGIGDPTQIYVGQTLVIPLPIGGGEEIAPATAPVSAAVENPVVESPPVAEVVEPLVQNTTVVVADPPPAAGEITHVVQANEGLAVIARTYGVSWVDIAQANGISNPDVIHAGQTLVIPNPTRAAPADYGQPVTTVDAGRSILVELSTQKIKAFQDGQLVREVTVSTGLPGTPTVLGEYQIYSKLPEQTMYGAGYYLPGVPWVMYFYQGYAIHGTYWHNNFGSPMSHGCVNLPTEDAAWFFEFAQVGTKVKVIP